MNTANGNLHKTDARSRGILASTEAPADPPALLTADQLAARWSVPKSQVYRMTRRGDLDTLTVKLGRYCRYSLTALREWESNGGTGSTTP